MRSLALAVLTLVAGCDVLFGLERGSAVDAGDGSGTAPDAAVDAAASAIISDLRLLDRANVNRVVEVRARIQHDPGEQVAYTIRATAGLFDQPLGTVQLDPSGGGELSVMYRAPAAPQTVTITLEALGETAQIIAPIHAVMVWGFDETGTGDITIGSNAAFGTRIVVNTAGSLDSLGFRVTSDAGMVKLALYTDVNNTPAQRLAETAARPVLIGRNSYPVTSMPLASGSYWLFALFDMNTFVRVNAAGGYLLRSQLYANGFPATYTGAPFTSTTGTQPIMFVTVGAN